MTVEELIIQIALDPSGLNKGQKDALATYAKIQEQAKDFGKKVEATTKGVADGFGKVTERILEVGAAFFSVRGVVDFTNNMVKLDSTLGRMAARIGQGISPTILSTWALAVERAGFGADAAAQAFDGWSAAVARFRNGLSTMPELGAFGALQRANPKLQFVDKNGKPTSIEEQFKELGEAERRLAADPNVGPRRALEMGTAVLGNRDFAQFLMQGRAGIEAGLKAEAPVAVTDKDVKVTEDFRKAWFDVMAGFERFGRDLEDTFLPIVTKVLGLLDRQNVHEFFRRKGTGGGASIGAEAGKLFPGGNADRPSPGATQQSGSPGGGGTGFFVPGVGWTDGNGKSQAVATVREGVTQGMRDWVRQSPASGGAGGAASGGGFWSSIASALGLGGDGGGAGAAGAAGAGGSRAGRGGRGARGGSGGDSGGGGGKAPTGSLKERGLALMNALIAKGWSPESAAIAAGNAQQESGINPNGPAGDGGISHGMMQWNKERYSALRSFAASQGKAWTDRDTQIAFLDREARQKGLNVRAGDLGGAAAWSHRFEGFGDNSGGKRAANARAWLAAWKAAHGAGGSSGGGGVGHYKNPSLPGNPDELMRKHQDIFKGSRYDSGAMSSLGLAHHAMQGTLINQSRVANNRSSSETNIHNMVVNTQASDAQGIARDIGPALKRNNFTTQANYGLA